jgi:anaerobic ribonucleoside-triphosphate reductase
MGRGFLTLAGPIYHKVENLYFLWVKKECICFDCGFRYDRRLENKCPRCGDERIFIASLHAEDYDIAKDPEALFKMRIYGIIISLALFITVLNLTH